MCMCILEVRGVLVCVCVCVCLCAAPQTVRHSRSLCSIVQQNLLIPLLLTSKGPTAASRAQTRDNVFHESQNTSRRPLKYSQHE